MHGGAGAEASARLDLTIVVTRLSRSFLRTLREDPSDAEVTSHRLLVRAGYIRRQAPGVFAWLPLGLKVKAKIEAVVREEMANAGAYEVHFPALLPREPYEVTGRWEEYGDALFRLQDRKGADYLLAPTHEEVFTLLVKDLYSSYKALPLSIYQIQDKYRDEARPRAGLLRGREFTMKDAYSFDYTDGGLDASYQAQRDAYERIFSRLGLEYVIVQADAGAMGGSRSEESRRMSNISSALSACPAIATSTTSVSRSPSLPLPSRLRPKPTSPSTPCSSRGTSVRGRRPGRSSARSPQRTSATSSTPASSTAPPGSPARTRTRSTCTRSWRVEVATVRDGDPAPDGSGPVNLARGMEIGHVFQLGRKYAEALGLKVLDENGKLVTVTMGSYGIGVTRILAIIAELNNDDKGLIWPTSVAPFDVHVVATGRDAVAFDLAASISDELEGAGLDVLYDDRPKVSPGVKFGDAELIGVPRILIVGRGAAEGQVELWDRRTGDREVVPVADAIARLGG